MQPSKYTLILEEGEIQQLAGILAEWTRLQGTNPNAVAKAGTLINKLQHAQKLDIDKNA